MPLAFQRAIDHIMDVYILPDVKQESFRVLDENFCRRRVLASPRRIRHRVPRSLHSRRAIRAALRPHRRNRRAFSPACHAARRRRRRCCRRARSAARPSNGLRRRPASPLFAAVGPPPAAPRPCRRPSHPLAARPLSLVVLALAAMVVSTAPWRPSAYWPVVVAPPRVCRRQAGRVSIVQLYRRAALHPLCHPRCRSGATFLHPFVSLRGGYRSAPTIAPHACQSSPYCAASSGRSSSSSPPAPSSPTALEEEGPARARRAPWAAISRA